MLLNFYPNEVDVVGWAQQRQTNVCFGELRLDQDRLHNIDEKTSFKLLNP